MRSCSPVRLVERARPLLGTLVAIRVYDLPEAAAHLAVDAAFAEIAAIHRAMSFHEADSDVSRLNREAFRRPVRVHAQTLAVLRLAQRVAEETDGSFDITTAAKLVAWRLLPPPSSCRPDPRANWRDIELHDDSSVRFLRPLWIDLGGIAKGYAVDRGIETLLANGARHCGVNAGGDLRVVGPKPERIWLRADARPGPFAALLELQDGSLASSGMRRADGAPAAHVDGLCRRPAGRDAFACVVAKSCAVADALTKPVLALGARCDAALQRLSATAHLLDEKRYWQRFGAEA
jgi:FAD:protein FMN transferase